MLSVVIPTYNEEMVIKETITQINHLLTESNAIFEIIVVNDGSIDKTLDICIALKKIYDFRIINLATNCGHMTAIMAGLEASRGNLVATMDSDLQDPPKDLVSMYKIFINKLQNPKSSNIDVIQAYRIDRSSDTFFKRITAEIYYKIIARITGIKIIHNAADFRIMTREVVDALIASSERNSIYRLLIPKMGFKIEPYPITRQKRFAGQSKYKLKTMSKLFIDSILTFSSKPLKYLFYLGMLSYLLMLTSFVVVLVIYFTGSNISVLLLILSILLTINALLLVGIGVIGEYIGRIYELVQNKPKVNWIEIV